MNRSPLLWLLAGVLLWMVGCADPGRIQSQREFERLQERSTPQEQERILPDFGTEPGTEEALRLPFDVVIHA